MWLFTKEGYLAITMNKQDTDLLHVRARVKGDIERYWPTAEIEYTPDADYLYRTNLPRTEVMNALAHHIVAIDYTSFKGSIEDRRRMPYITAIWESTIDMQEAIWRERMPTFKDYPIQECVEACERIVAEGGTVYQKWTCDGCGERVTGNDPNTFTMKGHCEGCDFTTDLAKKGCNYLVMYSV